MTCINSSFIEKILSEWVFSLKYFCHHLGKFRKNLIVWESLNENIVPVLQGREHLKKKV